MHCPDDLQFRLSAIFNEAGTERHEHVADHAAGPMVPSRRHYHHFHTTVPAYVMRVVHVT